MQNTFFPPSVAIQILQDCLQTREMFAIDQSQVYANNTKLKHIKFVSLFNLQALLHGFYLKRGHRNYGNLTALQTREIFYCFTSILFLCCANILPMLAIIHVSGLHHEIAHQTDAAAKWCI